MKTLNWNVDQNGMLHGLGLHDGTLCGVLVDGDAVWLFATSYSGENRLIQFSNVTATNVMNFWKGSIVGETWFFDKEAVPAPVWSKFLEGQIPSHDYQNAISNSIRAIRGTKVFVLESSYGADVYIACDEMHAFSYVGHPFCIGSEPLALGATTANPRVTDKGVV